MFVTEYFGKLRTISDELAVAGCPVSSLDFIIHLISGLGQPYYPVVVYIKANVLKMSINEAYSMLLTHEARLASNMSNASKEAKLNYAANIVQAGNSQKKSGNNGDWNNNGQGNWNGNYVNKGGAGNWNGNYHNRGGYGLGRGGFSGPNSGRGWNGNSGRGGGFSRNGNFPDGFSGNEIFLGVFNGFGRESGRGNITCQICFKPNHSAADCKNRFNRDFFPQFSAHGHFSNQNQGSKAAYMATSEGVADQGWYLDSGAAHHLTNNVENLAEG